MVAPVLRDQHQTTDLHQEFLHILRTVGTALGQHDGTVGSNAGTDPSTHVLAFRIQRSAPEPGQWDPRAASENEGAEIALTLMCKTIWLMCHFPRSHIHHCSFKVWGGGYRRTSRHLSNSRRGPRPRFPSILWRRGAKLSLPSLFISCISLFQRKNIHDQSIRRQ